jgi:hypothetical protein
MHGESASVETEEAEKFCRRFQEFVQKEESRPEQIFNCNETGLFWKRMPNRTYIMKGEEKSSWTQTHEKPIDVTFGS